MGAGSHAAPGGAVATAHCGGWLSAAGRRLADGRPPGRRRRPGPTEVRPCPWWIAGSGDRQGFGRCAAAVTVRVTFLVGSLVGAPVRGTCIRPPWWCRPCRLRGRV